MECLRQMALAIFNRFFRMNRDLPPPEIDPPPVVHNEEPIPKVKRLEAKQNLEKTLFRVSQGSVIKFCLGPTFLGHRTRLYSNYPEDNVTFSRQKFRHHRWSENKEDASCYANLKFNLPGSYRYFVVAEDEDDDLQIDCSGYIIVDPDLEVGAEGEKINLDSIVCQTVMSKLLGTFDTWQGRLQVSQKCSYNMLHFTPIQELGGSQSAYSIRDQLTLNPKFSHNTQNPEHNFGHVGNLLEYIRKEWSMVSITDIVLNHTANETPWIFENPDCCYNLRNTPHLKPAYLLDRMFWHFTLDIINGKWAERGLSIEVSSEAHLSTIEQLLWEHYLPLVKIEEFFIINPEKVSSDFKHNLIQIAQCKVYPNKSEKAAEKLEFLQDARFRRLKNRVEPSSSLNLVAWDVSRSAITKDLVDERALLLKPYVDEMNEVILKRVKGHIQAAVANSISQIRYERVDPQGPRKRYISRTDPLLTPYFTTYGPERSTIQDEEKSMYDESICAYCFAHNGWVMGFDPLQNFCDPNCDVYLRRELISWGDSVKLRYGGCFEDNPVLWSYMRTYVEETAKVFHGFRLDNCHSTPLHVAEFMLDAARKVRPSLYTIAELFTQSEEMDNLFVNRLGINSLIRESMAACDSHELGRYIHRYGGEPVGAFEKVPPISLLPSRAHAILYDMTHDNECPMEKRSVFDYFATASLVAMSPSAISSSRGYDEFIPHHVHVVKEWRPWAFWGDSSGPEHVTYSDGMIHGRKVINELHKKLAVEGYSELFVDQVNYDVIAITRHNPATHKSIILIARTSFYKPPKPWETGFIKPLDVEGYINRIVFEARLVGDYEEFHKSSQYVNGLKNMKVAVRQDIKVSESDLIKLESKDEINRVHFQQFCPGSVVCLEVFLDTKAVLALNGLNKMLQNIEELSKLTTNMTLDDLNFILFRTDQEEVDEFSGGVYRIPNFKSLNYCGLAGLMFYWQDIRINNDLGHPICTNLREGLWLPDYIVSRLTKRSSTVTLSDWFKRAFVALKDMPVYLRPHYFDLIVRPIYNLLIDKTWSLLSGSIINPNGFSRSLIFGSLALVGFNKTSALPPLAESISDPKPSIIEIEGIPRPRVPTIAAGLPHFASGFMRNWGRDTFISIRGLLLVTGRFDEARYLILGFAGVLCHGLIPNLLDKATNARYNCRDAVWWWLQAIKEYCKFVTGGCAILNEPVRRVFPTDDSEPVLTNDHIQPLHKVMQEALNRHFKGIEFRERNAGTSIDAHMTDEGFNIKVGVDKETGFVYGGNEWNCGTWMDKMGSSDKAGNRGKPATPRDGSAVELVGLCKSVVTWLGELWDSGKYPHESVTSNGTTWTWKEWADRIKANFEPKFWVGLEDEDPLTNRREIYKDSVGSTHRWQDFQLRPNFLVAMVVAPEMFTPSRALRALAITKEVLVSSLGIKTLDPTDWNYRGDYHNDDDSDDYKVAHGFNYHQGPEWLWPMGYYIRANYHFNSDKEREIVKMLKILAKHYVAIETNTWFGLPELTNSGGAYCQHSCHNQAWTLATILDCLYDSGCI